MVPFVPRPWYQHCCRHNWLDTLWHALLSWPCKMSLLLLKKTTWWAHNPQFHRIETWLSYTPLFPMLFLMLGFVCNSRATFRVIINSGIKHNTYSRCFEPVSHCFRQRTIVYPLETSYGTFLLGSRYVSFVQFERYSCVHSWVDPKWFPLIPFYRCRASHYLLVSMT